MEKSDSQEKTEALKAQLEEDVAALLDAGVHGEEIKKIVDEIDQAKRAESTVDPHEDIEDFFVGFIKAHRQQLTKDPKFVEKQWGKRYEGKWDKISVGTFIKDPVFSSTGYRIIYKGGDGNAYLLNFESDRDGNFKLGSLTAKSRDEVANLLVRYTPLKHVSESRSDEFSQYAEMAIRLKEQDDYAEIRKKKQETRDNLKRKFDL